MAHYQGRIAKRYARALFESYAPDQVEVVLHALNEFSKTWKTNSELRATLTTPVVKVEQRKNALKEIVSRIRSNDVEFSNFFQILLENDRLSYIPLIAEIFEELVHNLKRLLSLEVVSAFEVSTQERASLEDRISKEFGSLSSVSWKVDPSLIGGLSIKAGDTILDGSLKGALERIRGELLA